MIIPRLHHHLHHHRHRTSNTRIARALISFLAPVLMAATSATAGSGGLKNKMAGKDKSIILQGDIIFGGLFPMHEMGIGGEVCGAIKEEKGIQRVEAMLYAIDLINQDPELLPGVIIGAHILDTCLRDTYALEQSLEFIKPYMSSLDEVEYQCRDGIPPTRRESIAGIPRQPIAGVIGASASPVSIMVANMLRLFKIPQISYASTGIELSDKTRFGYFSRVVPPDSFQAQALVDIVRKFGWTYVSTVADEGNYGEKGIDAFERLAKKSGVCISKSLKIPRDVQPDTFVKILDELRDQSSIKARVVVMFVNEDNCRRLVNATIALHLTDTFYWLASDSWGAKTVPVNEQELAAVGTVTILPERKVLQGFDEYFTSLTPENNLRNKWFVEFWESHFGCIYVPTTDVRIRHVKTCTGDEKIRRPKYDQEGVVPFVVDAVYALAHALDNMIKAHCDGKHFCEVVDPPDGKLLLGYIRNVTFIGAAGYEVQFNEQGDAKGRYTIYQYQRDHRGPVDSFDYVPIGNWTDTLNIDTSLMRWKHENHSIPVSVCAEPCPPGHAKKTEGQDVCCWVCIQCPEYAILEDDVCRPCPNGTYPDTNKTTCVDLDVDYMSMDSPWAVVSAAVSALGVTCVLFVFGVFVRYNSTPVIMASGRELCYVLMLGMLMCFSMTFVMVSKPTMLTCTLMRVGLGLSLSICYAALFTKTNRISRIFNRGVKAMVKRPSYTSPRSQLVICFCLVLVQLVGAITWVCMDLPHTALVYPDRRSVVLRCKSTNLAVVLSLMYNMVLVVLCTVYAFLTRKIPENFNEAKYIAFTMYSTCIVWLAFIPIYFGTNKADLKLQITALCMSVSISAYVAMACLFFPKVYIVLFQPHKNVRQSSKGLSPGTRPGLFGCSPAALGLSGGGVDPTNPTGLAMLIAHGAVQLKTQSAGGGGCGGGSSNNVVCINTTTSGTGSDDFDKICESMTDLNSAIIEKSEQETVDL